jgi:pimeloyl-ACP methyl ester carboxylesterase
MNKPTLHFCHANSYPVGTYRQLFALLRQDFDVQALEMHAHNPAYPVREGWNTLADELIAELEARYAEPVIVAGHSLGGILCLLAAAKRPDLVRCAVMLDSPVVAGWRALALRLLRRTSLAERYSPARFSVRRRNVWPDAEAAYSHFAAKDIFAAWAPGVLRDYIDSGLVPHPEGVQLRFGREVETAVYRALPHHVGGIVRRGLAVPVGFIGGVDSVECRQAGLAATRKLVGPFFRQLPGGHLFPMESPVMAAQAMRDMIAALLAREASVKILKGMERQGVA